MYRRMFKRIIDMTIAAAASMLLSPLILVVALVIRIRMGRPVLFRQLRPGIHERPFTLLKFRSMMPERDQAGNPIDDTMRITPLGLRLRALSLDELPQLWNIFRGDMSLVGPRPLLDRYLPYYTPDESRRHSVLPGLTGWAQINGRNDVEWDRRLSLDIWYVDHLSFLLDVEILLRTFSAVLWRRGVREDPAYFMIALDEARDTERADTTVRESSPVLE